MKDIWNRRHRTYPMRGWRQHRSAATNPDEDEKPSVASSLRGYRRKPGTIPGRSAPYQRPT